MPRSGEFESGYSSSHPMDRLSQQEYRSKGRGYNYRKLTKAPEPQPIKSRIKWVMLFFLLFVLIVTLFLCFQMFN